MQRRYLFHHLVRRPKLTVVSKLWTIISTSSFFLFCLTIVAPIAPPPSELPRGGADSSSRRGNASVPNIDDVTAREAVLSYVSQYHCWGMNAARQMTIMDITASSAFHVKNAVIIKGKKKKNSNVFIFLQYNLETCTEKRSAVWIHEPYTGQVIDTADQGPSPKPWDVLVVPPNPYKVIVSFVNPCNSIFSSGYL